MLHLKILFYQKLNGVGKLLYIKRYLTVDCNSYFTFNFLSFCERKCFFGFLQQG